MSNQNENFDFEMFAIEALRNIDALRSNKKDGVKPVESRINAFYRALGLPAVVPENNEDLPEGRPDGRNNGNLQDLSFSRYKSDLDERQNLYNKEIDEEEISEFMDLNRKSIRSGVSKDSDNRRQRGVLFPMVVDGRIHVFPVEKRIGGAFMTTKELRIGGTIYRRPLIETILLIKLKGDNAVDSSKQSSVSSALNSPELKKVSENAGKRLSTTLNSVAYFVEETIRMINGLRNEIGANVIPTVENVAQQNHRVEESEERTGRLEQMDANQEAQVALQNTVLSLFEFDDTAGKITRNLSGEDLASVLIDMLVPAYRSKRNADLLNRQITKARVGLKKAFRNLDLILGTFASISGIDIMVVMLALYRLDPEYLVGLLNKESQDRLLSVKGNISALQGAKTVSASISKLETEVIKIFDELSEYIKISKHDKKIRHQVANEEK